jgi:aminoglycoside phosphotransferase (APT) family kinase protein
MHVDQLDVDVPLVRRLVAAQFPEWAELSIEPVPRGGTDNALFRLGPDLVARLPVTESKAATLAKERGWLPRLAPHLPLAVPVPVAEGDPGEGYPCIWSVYAWLRGEDATVAPLVDPGPQLAAFIRALQAVDASGGPPAGGRGGPLADRDGAFRASLAALPADLGRDALAAEWESALRAPEWDGPPVWIHGDLDARNVLVEDGRLTGVVDWGSLAVGDPACEVMVAWKLVPAAARDAFRAALAVDDATWQRGRGWALSQAVAALAYYTMETNPVLVVEARRWLAEVLADQ